MSCLSYDWLLIFLLLIGFFSMKQSKRVPVSIRFSADSGLKPYYLTIAKKLKEWHPDILLDRHILPAVKGGENDESLSVFEVLVDGKIVVEKKKRGDSSVFVSMGELDLAIARARRKRRPSTDYGEDLNSSVLSEMLRIRKSAD
jgi:hypothetical protein